MVALVLYIRGYRVRGQEGVEEEGSRLETSSMKPRKESCESFYTHLGSSGTKSSSKSEGCTEHRSPSSMRMDTWSIVVL